MNQEEIAKQTFKQLGTDLGAFIDERQVRYGNSFGKSGEFLKILYPDGIKPEQYTDMLAIVRIFDKQMRLATGKNDDGETPYKDIAGYGLLGWMKEERQSGRKEDPLQVQTVRGSETNG